MYAQDISPNICTSTVRYDKVGHIEMARDRAAKCNFAQSIHIRTRSSTRVQCRNAATHDEVPNPIDRQFGTLSNYRSANEPCNRKIAACLQTDMSGLTNNLVLLISTTNSSESGQMKIIMDVKFCFKLKNSDELTMANRPCNSGWGRSSNPRVERFDTSRQI